MSSSLIDRTTLEDQAMREHGFFVVRFSIRAAGWFFNIPLRGKRFFQNEEGFPIPLAN